MDVSSRYVGQINSQRYDYAPEVSTVKLNSGASKNIVGIVGLIAFSIFTFSASSELEYEAPVVATVLRFTPFALIALIILRMIAKNSSSGSSSRSSAPTFRNPNTYDTHGSGSTYPPPYSAFQPGYAYSAPYNSYHPSAPPLNGGLYPPTTGYPSYGESSMHDVASTNHKSLGGGSQGHTGPGSTYWNQQNSSSTRYPSYDEPSMYDVASTNHKSQGHDGQNSHPGSGSNSWNSQRRG